jgi:hypothetical protein
MTLKEKLHLLHSLRQGDMLDLPVVEASSSSHSSCKAARELEP